MFLGPDRELKSAVLTPRGKTVEDVRNVRFPESFKIQDSASKLFMIL